MSDRLKIVPLTLEQANELVGKWHRHHNAAIGCRWSIGVRLGSELVGAAIVGRPVAHNTPQYSVAEITRLVTNGTKDACSKLYGAVARIAREMGYDRVQTAILISESGISLKAAGFKFSHFTEGGSWDTPSRRRIQKAPTCRKAVFVKEFRRAISQTTHEVTK